MCRLLRLLTLGTVLVLTGCDGNRADDGPLPSFEELRREFDGQPEGRGVVREGEREAFSTTATYFVSGEGELGTVVIDLRNQENQAGLSMTISINSSNNHNIYSKYAGMSYGSPGCIGVGGGVAQITRIDSLAISGVFAGDVTTRTLVPCRRRLTGGFTATLTTPR